MRKTLLTLLLILASGSAGAQDAAALVKRDCMSCHGNEVYTRSNRMVTSLDGLRHQIARCHQATGKNWSAGQVDNVVRYLNNNFYKF